MKQLLSSLIALQGIDTKLSEIEMLRGDLPLLVGGLRKEVDDLRDEIEADQKLAGSLGGEKSDLTNELALNSEKLKKFQDQLYKATSNKEYEATSAQIDFCEQEISRIKTRITEVELKVLELEEGLKPKEERLTALLADFSEREKELQEKVLETSKEEDELRIQRDRVLPLIRKDVINKYERIRKAKNGLAVAVVVKDSCGGCFNQIPPQIVIELRKRDHIRTCEFCGRILYYDQAADSENLKEKVSS